MLQLLDDFYGCLKEEEAELVFKRMTSWMMHSRLEAMKGWRKAYVKRRRKYLPVSKIDSVMPLPKE